jgi:hypothetical protein
MTMKINVMMASGDTDEWEDAADAIDDRGSLIVLYDIEGDEVPSGMKVMEVVREIEQYTSTGDNGLQVPTKMTKGQTFQVVAQYAPGMWIKVEFE